MKTDKHNMDLEQLLADMEHAGRDARRQQELSAMIDRMSAAEGSASRHGFWWWSARVAAAACVLFFISTAVRIWFIPTGATGTMVAETDIPTVVNQKVADSATLPMDANRPSGPYQGLTKNLPRTYQGLTIDYQGGSREVDQVAQSEVFTEEENALIVAEVYLVEKEGVVEIVDTAEIFPVVEEDVVSDTVMIVHVFPEPEQPAQPEPVSAKPQERKHSIISDLLRRREPSKMDGTVLAINIL